MHGVSDLVERSARFLARARAALFDDAVDARRIRRVASPPLTDRPQELLDRDDQPSLHLDVADLALAIATFEILDLRFVLIEDVVESEDRIALDAARRRRAHSVGVRVHPHDLLLDRFG